MTGSSSGRLKVHRRTMPVDGRRHTVLSPRQDVGCRFATHLFHDTWHLLTDIDDKLLGRLCWAMAYQRRERTLLVIDPGLLGSQSIRRRPVVADRDREQRPGTARSLRGSRTATAQLPFSAASEGTVVVQTRGLDAALADEAAFRQRGEKAGFTVVRPPATALDRQDRRDRRGGGVAPGPCRAWGVELSGLGRRRVPRDGRHLHGR